MKESPASYSPLQIALHWTIALLATIVWFDGGLGRTLRDRANGDFSAGWPSHVWLGLIVLALVIIRMGLRLARGAPGPVENTSEAFARARHWGHWAIYVLLLVVPLLGVGAWFLANHNLGDIHSLAGNIFIALAGGHAALALWHHYVLHDTTLVRMLRPGTPPAE